MDLKEAQLVDYKVASRHPWELARLEIIVKLLKQRHPNLFTERCNILDFGCGDLWLVEQLSALMPRAQFIAIDHRFNFLMLHAYNVKYGASQVPISVFDSLEESYNAHAGRIDLVLMLDVLQQSGQEEEFLNHVACHPGISAQTPWLLTVPAGPSLFNDYDEFLENRRRYNRKGLGNLLASANFTVNKTGYFFFGLWLLRFMQKLGKFKYSKLSAWSPNNKHTHRIKNLLISDFNIMQGIRYCRMQLPGLSVYAFFQKKDEVKISGPC